MNLSKTARSFRFAWQGVFSLLRFENNAQVHLIAAIMAIMMGFWLHISTLEWVAVICLIGLVMAAEAFNTAIEKLCDYVSPGQHPLIGHIKDIAAAGVLLVALAAALCGGIIFIPKLYHLIV